MEASFMRETSSKNRAVTTRPARPEQVGESADAGPPAASGSRRRPADAAADSSRFAALRATQVREVGAAFLRARPLVIAPIALSNTLLLARSGAPLAQRLALGGGIGMALVLFFLERWWLRRARVGERWLALSLAATSVILAGACAVSGGLASPIFPLTLAPVVVAAAAFGRTATTIAASVLSLGLAAALATVPIGTLFPAIPPPYDRAMMVVSVAGLLLLSYAGVAGLVAAYVRAGELLERMRLATIEEAASRMRATEQVGAKVAHELKNPLAAIKALLQLLRDRVDDKGTKRLEVALAEVDRMDLIVRDYLAFARPLADLEISTVALDGVANDVVAVLEARAQLARIALTARGACSVSADARRVREALFNLVDNAITATPDGGSVTIEVTAVVGGAEVSIEDTGPGIPPELAAAPPFTTTRAEGTGLGLTLARAAIGQHGGTLVFLPRPAGGTIARMRIPSHPGAAA